MIQVTRLNNTSFVVNADLIETIEATPDTVVTLTTERKYVVRESVDELIRRVIDYKRDCLTPVYRKAEVPEVPEVPAAAEAAAIAQEGDT